MCTLPTIAANVHFADRGKVHFMPAKKVHVKELRSSLKEHLESKDPVIVLNHGRQVAVILPTGLSYFPNPKQVEQALARMKDMLGAEMYHEMR